MKSLLVTALLSTGIAHTGAFLSVWELPYVENHFTIEDLGRKINNVTNWNETTNSLRDRREQVADEHYAMYDHRADEDTGEPQAREGYRGASRAMAREQMKTRSRIRR